MALFAAKFGFLSLTFIFNLLNTNQIGIKCEVFYTRYLPDVNRMPCTVVYICNITKVYLRLSMFIIINCKCK